MALYDDLISPDLRIRNARSELDENYLFDPANEIPNAETIAALQEYEEMMKHPERYKTYATFAEAVADILSEDSENSFSDYSFSALRIDEEDGSVTLALNEIDLVENVFSIIFTQHNFYNSAASEKKYHKIPQCHIP